MNALVPIEAGSLIPFTAEERESVRCYAGRAKAPATKAKETLLAAGHCFERARHEFGFEEGVFLDGAFLSSADVIAMADISPHERKERLAKARCMTKT
jgi:hypothetical protein